MAATLTSMDSKSVVAVPCTTSPTSPCTPPLLPPPPPSPAPHRVLGVGKSAPTICLPTGSYLSTQLGHLVSPPSSTPLSPLLYNTGGPPVSPHLMSSSMGGGGGGFSFPCEQQQHDQHTHHHHHGHHMAHGTTEEGLASIDAVDNNGPKAIKNTEHVPSRPMETLADNNARSVGIPITGRGSATGCQVTLSCPHLVEDNLAGNGCAGGDRISCSTECLLITDSSLPHHTARGRSCCHCCPCAGNSAVGLGSPSQNPNLLCPSPTQSTAPPIILLWPPAAVNFQFSQLARPGRDHNARVTSEYFSDLQAFVGSRSPSLDICWITKDRAHLESEGYRQADCFAKLTPTQVDSAVKEIANFHAAGLAYRLSLKEGFEEKYPWLTEDLFTCSLARELLAKYLDSYLHYLSLLPGAEPTVSQLRKIEQDVFQYIVTLRKPTDALGARFATVCHGDLWTGNLLFKESGECALKEYHCSAYLSPVTDVANLILSSTSRDFARKNWESIVEYYYTHFSEQLARFGLVLRHLGTSYNHFLQEVRRALAGQFLVVAVVVPILAARGPREWPMGWAGRRRSSSSDRQNTVRHLIQMMAITEELESSSEEEEEDLDDVLAMAEGNIPTEWEAIHRNENLRADINGLLLTAAELNILDWIKPETRPRALSWDKTRRTTAKHIPVYCKTGEKMIK